MTPQELISRVIDDLKDSGFKFALVGALAVGARGIERTTKDIDFAIASSNTEESLKLVKYLISAKGYRLLRAPDFHVDLTMRPMVSVAPPVEPEFCIDLLFNLCGIESEVVQRAETLEILPGVFVKVALRSDLIAMKTLSFDDQRRLHDIGDLKGLLEAATEQDIAATREALELIESRNMGKINAKDDLIDELRQHCLLYAPKFVDILRSPNVSKKNA